MNCDRCGKIIKDHPGRLCQECDEILKRQVLEKLESGNNDIPILLDGFDMEIDKNYRLHIKKAEPETIDKRILIIFLDMIYEELKKKPYLFQGIEDHLKYYGIKHKILDLPFIKNPYYKIK